MKARFRKVFGGEEKLAAPADVTVAGEGESVGRREGRRELADARAEAYINEARAVKQLGDLQAAVALYLASAYMNKANAVSALGDNPGAAALYEQAIGIWERLVSQEGRRDLVGDLAWVKALRSATLVNLGEKAKGLREMREAHGVLEAEIARTDRSDPKQVLKWVKQLANR